MNHIIAEPIFNVLINSRLSKPEFMKSLQQVLSALPEAANIGRKEWIVPSNPRFGAWNPENKVPFAPLHYAAAAIFRENRLLAARSVRTKHPCAIIDDMGMQEDLVLPHSIQCRRRRERERESKYIGSHSRVQPPITTTYVVSLFPDNPLNITQARVEGGGRAGASAGEGRKGWSRPLHRVQTTNEKLPLPLSEAGLACISIRFERMGAVLRCSSGATTNPTRLDGWMDG